MSLDRSELEQKQPAPQPEHPKPDQKAIEQKADIVIVGAGPVGLDAARKIKEKNPNLSIVMLERYKVYQRSQRVHLKVPLVENQQLIKELWKLTTGQNPVGKKINNETLELPIQTLEVLFKKYAEKSGVIIDYKHFLTQHQFDEECKHHNVHSQLELEEKTKEQYVIDIDEITKKYPHCKMIIGADGARSVVRELVAKDEKTPVENTDLRTMLELKYQVRGKAHPINPLLYIPAHIEMKTAVCSEHFKYDPKTNTTEITLRFVTDPKLSQDPKLKNVTAKNLLHVRADNIPEELYRIINIWVNMRGDRNILPRSLTLNKTVLSIYSCKQLHNTMNNVLLLLVGDAACGFPYMNGLNIGIANATELSNLIANQYNALAEGKDEVIDKFYKTYAAAVQANFKKGELLVNRADHKIESSLKFTGSLNKVSLIANTPLKNAFFPRQAIWDSNLLVDSVLPRYVEGKKRHIHSLEYLLSDNLLNLLTVLNKIQFKTTINTTDDIETFTMFNQHFDHFEYIKAILFLAYKKNLMLEVDKDDKSVRKNAENARTPMEFLSSWLGIFTKLEHPLPNREEVKQMEFTDNDIFMDMKIMKQIPDKLTKYDGTPLAQDFHKVLKHLDQRTDKLFKPNHDARTRARLSIHDAFANIRDAKFDLMENEVLQYLKLK